MKMSIRQKQLLLDVIKEQISKEKEQSKLFTEWLANPTDKTLERDLDWVSKETQESFERLVDIVFSL